MSNPPDVDLETFRRQWQEEVTSRRRRESRGNAAPGPSTAPGVARRESITAATGSSGIVPDLQAPRARDGYHEGWLDGGSYNFDDLEAREEARRLGTGGVGVHPESRKEPQTALEHFERAVEKEGQGNMQDSLIHYRRAYRLDDQVDRAYRNKHFPPNKFPTKPTNPNPSNKSVTVPNTAHHSLHGSQITLSQLVASFAGTPIQAVVPDVEGDPQLPCPISSVPHEILVGILNELAVLDVASLMRTSLVCKHLAYVTHAEDAIWRRVCHDSRFGFKDMKYNFTMTHKWEDLPRMLDDEIIPSLDSLSIADHSEDSNIDPATTTTMTNHDEPPKLLLPHPTLTPAYPSYLSTFHTRPRLRFTGVYISTVNYIRSGIASSNSVYWGNSPVHMVTYYRYLRFYRDGSAISLLTFFEPHDVVPLLHRENLLAARGKTHKADAALAAQAAQAAQSSLAPGSGAAQHTQVQPVSMLAVMREARKARWRMSAPRTEQVQPRPDADEPKSDAKGESDGEPEGNVYVELEGPTRSYTYHMQLALRSGKAAGAAKNTKLAWRSFWSYNHLSDDWGEFTLKNDRAYVFSRVKSWADA